MSEKAHHFRTESPSEKSFGIVFSLIFLIISVFPLINGQPIYFWALIVSAFCLFLAYFFPNTLLVPNKLWFKFGILLGSIIAPIVMIFVYFFTIFPTGIIMRLLGKDLLNQKLDKNINSYWIERKDSMETMKNQY